MLGASVFSHISFLSEASATYVAQMWLFPRMYLNVVIQSFRSSESLFTVMALVSAIATVYQSVLIKHGPSQESLIAHVAFEWSLSRMLLPNVIR